MIEEIYKLEEKIYYLYEKLNLDITTIISLSPVIMDNLFIFLQNIN